MENANEPEVKIIETRQATSVAGDDDELIEMGTENPDSSSEEENQSEESDESEKDKKEELVVRKKEEDTEEPLPLKYGSETPRERALRMELDRQREKARNAEIALRTQNIVGSKQEKEKDTTVLDEYDPDELQKFERVFDAMAEKKGYVRKDEVQAETYHSIALAEVDKFIKENPQYDPSNDEGGVLWTQLESELNRFIKPENPKDYAELLKRANREILGIQPSENLTKVKAQQEKLKTASHAGAGKKAYAPRAASNKQDLRSAFKGYSEEELDEMLG